MGRALLFGAVALILCILLGFMVPATALASGQFVVYGTLVALLASIVYEIEELESSEALLEAS